MRRVPTRRESVRRTPTPTPRTPLKRRRREARKRLLLFIGIGLLVLFAVVEAVLWQSFLRVEAVHAEGPDAERIEKFVQEDLRGTRFLVFPKSSIFFLPERSLREHILAEFPSVEAVSISASGLTTLTVKGTGRSSVFWWCGQSYSMPQGSCYETDAQGLVFAPVDLGATASTTMLWVYAPLASTSEATTSPTGLFMRSPERIPAMLQFVKAMKSLNADIASVDIRGDEADLYTNAGTRITYVLGREQAAANLAASSFATLNLNDGSLLYVDLRFPDKVYFKKRDE